MTDIEAFLTLLQPYRHVDAVADNRMYDGTPEWMFNGMITPTLYPIEQRNIADASEEEKQAIIAYQNWRTACQDYKAADRPILTPPQLGEDYREDPLRKRMSDALNEVIAWAWRLLP